MPVLPANPPITEVPPAPNTVGQVITNALYEINVVAPGENPDPLEMNFALSKFNQLLDSWSARAEKIYAYDLLSATPGPSPTPYLLVPNLYPHTIGPAAFPSEPTAPTPTFIVNGERPVRIKHINILLNNVTPVVRYPCTKRDKDWWATERVQTITTTLPTDFYYRPDWPLGSIFFWPVPSYAYGVEIEIETFLNGAANLTTQFIFPPGYELAITLTLAELLCPSFEKQPNPILVASALRARQSIDGLNAQPPRIDLGGDWTTSTRKPRPSFNYHTGYST
jgi:hypothetical protein